MATPRKKFEQPFNRKIPPIFRKGGILSTAGSAKDMYAKLKFMVEMPEEHFDLRHWMSLYKTARKELADLCFLTRRCPTYAELSQLEWLEEAGHKLWWEDKGKVRCDLNSYIESLEREVKQLRAEVDAKEACVAS